VENKIREKLKELASAINTSEILAEADAFFDKENNNEKLAQTLKNKIEGCKTTALSLYKDKASGLITESEYIEMSESLREERGVYETRLKELYDEQNRCSEAKNMTELLNNIISFDNLDRNTLLMLVDKIYIGKNKEVEVIFKFNNPINEN